MEGLFQLLYLTLTIIYKKQNRIVYFKTFKYKGQ